MYVHGNTVIAPTGNKPKAHSQQKGKNKWCSQWNTIKMNTANNNDMDDPHKYNVAQEKLTKKNIECMARSHQVCKW